MGAIGVLAVVMTFAWSAPSASAAIFTETQTDSIGATSTNWSTPPGAPDPLTFNQFDVTKGTLTQVRITFNATLTGSMAAENLATSVCEVELNWGANVTLDTTGEVLATELSQTR